MGQNQMERREQIIQQDKEYTANTYNKYDVCIQKGKGATCYDVNGKKYIDLTSGIGVNSLGFCNDKWVTAVTDQAKKLQHTSNFYYHEPGVELAKNLCEKTRYKKAFLCNSGAEANEAAIKIARKRSYDKYGMGRDTIISLTNSFHGRTITTLSATGQNDMRNYYFPFTEGFVFATANDKESFKSKIGNNVCGIIIEIIQGEGGVVPLDKEFVRLIKQICVLKDMTLIVDEVQTGISRTGTLLCSQQYDIRPDIVTLAKGLGGGLPIGAVLLDETCENVLKAGDHGTTFGGNPIVCAGANEVLNQVADEKFLEQVKAKAEFIKEKLKGMEEITSVDGMGLMIGMGLSTKKAREVACQCAEKGLLVLTAKDKLRLLPPLNISEEELGEAMEILKTVLN